MLPQSLQSKYKVIDKPGDEQWCEVFTAKVLESDALVTIKVLQEKIEEVSERGRRFLRSARNWSSIEHDGIVRLIDYGIADGSPFTVEQFLSATTLRDYLSGSKPDMAFAIKVAKALTSALAYAHSQSVVHRNLKPENILISERNEIIVSGWGMARAYEEKSNLTKTGVVMGTPGYVAPEQIIAGQVDQRGDLYALGAIVFEIVAHRRPFPHKEALKVLQAQVSKAAPKLSRYAKAVPKELDKLVASLLKKEPEKRPQSALEVEKMLDAITDIEEQTAVTPARRVKRQHKKSAIKSKSPWLVAALVLLLLLLPLAYYSFSSSLKTGPKSTREGLSVRSVELVDYDLVQVRFSGKKEGFVSVSICTEDDEPILKEPIEVSLANGKTVTKSVFVVGLQLPSPMANPFKLNIAPLGSFLCKPQKHLARLLAPVAALKPRLPTLLRQSIKLKQSYAGLASAAGLKSKAEVRENFASMLEKHGLSRDKAKKLDEILPKLLKQQVFPGSSLAKMLLPLRHIEAIIADKQGLVVPGGPLTKQLGFAFSSQLEPPKEPWRQVASKVLKTPGLTHFVPGIDAGRLNQSADSPQGAWIICPVAKKQYTSVMRNTAALKLFTSGEKSIVHFATYDTKDIFTLKKSQLQKANKARIDLLFGNWALDHLVEMRVNSSPKMTLFNTGVLSKGVTKTGHYAFIRMTVPIPLDLLSEGENTLRLRAVSTPGFVAKATIVVREYFVSLR